MKILTSAAIASLRGKLGGSVFSRRAGFVQVSTKVSPRGTINSRTQNNKAFMQVVSQSWKSLTDAQRKQWSEFATTNLFLNFESPSLCRTGFDLFKRSNYAAWQRFKALGYTAPYTGALPYPTNMAVSYNQALDRLDLVYSPAGTSANSYQVLWVSKAVSLGSRQSHDTWRLSSAAGSWLGSNTNFINAYRNAWGSLPPAGSEFTVKFVLAYAVNADFPIFGPYSIRVT
jgi:hypothetical protein